LLNEFIVRKHVKAALIEDIGYGDITTDTICSGDDRLEVFLVARESSDGGIFCGEMPFRLVFEILGGVKVEFYSGDGDRLSGGQKIAKISGSARSVLTGERVALNYVQKMSGIATYTDKFVRAAGGGVKITDTRKSTPNFRIFEKYAVKVGGGSLHRFNLSDCVMLKDNHIALCGGSITCAVEKVRKNISHAHKIEVECDTLEQVKEALGLGVDIIMLDNMSMADIKKSVEIISGRTIVEVSGGVGLNTVAEIAAAGVDIISTSALVAHAPTLDLGFDNL